MQLVTCQDESERLQREMPSPVPLFDIVLDDSSLVPTVAVVADRALGVIVGGHTGLLPFSAVPQLHSRRVLHALRLAPLHRLPFIGRRLRRWARRLGASPNPPVWIPKL